MINKGNKCSVAQCDKDAFCKGLCSKHYQQMKFKGAIAKKNYVYIDGICMNVGCGRKVFAKGMCQRCYVASRKK